MNILIGSIKFSASREIFFKVAAQMIFSLFLSFISISMFIRDSRVIHNSIKSGLPALDEWYYQKIYYFSKKIINLSQPFVDDVDFSNRNIETLNFGDLFYRIIFKFFPNDISISYLVSTIILLSLWIYSISILVMASRKTNFYFTATISVICILIFFGNSRLPNNDYPFARLVSPQFVGLVWVFATLLVFFVVDNKSCFLDRNVLTFFAFSTLVLFASFTYLYLFLTIQGALLVLILNLIRLRAFDRALNLFLSSAVGALPYIISILQKLDEIRFTEASLRMGLVESRVPGGAKTIILCLLCISILNSSKIIKLSFQNSIKKTLTISSIGILIANLSNLFTNISIQFSYHFEIFAWLNCLIIATLILTKLLDRVFSNIDKIMHRNIFITFCIIITPISYFLAPDFNYSTKELKEIQKTMQLKFGNKSNLIVDAKGFQSAFRIYSESKIFYQEDIIPHGYSNYEILERYFISSGCSDKLTDDEMLKPLVYYIEASEQKGKSLQKNLKLIGLENQFRFLFEPLIATSRERNESAIGFIKLLRSKFKPSNCLEIARQKGINFIIFDNSSMWGEILAAKTAMKSDLGLKNIFFLRL